MFTIVGLLCSVSAASPFALAQAKRPFTVADDISLVTFGGPQGQQGSPKVLFSPDGSYFATYTSLGRLDVNRVEDSLRFYRSLDAESFLKRPDGSEPPAPVWVVNRSDQAGPIVNDWRWLPDSSGVAFLEGRKYGYNNRRLILADLRRKVVEPLTSEGESVTAFDIRDRQHYVYTVGGQSEREKLQAKMKAELQSSVIVGTGREFDSLVFPDDPYTVAYQLASNSQLWAFVGGKRFEVKHDGAPLVPQGGLALSPDGVSVVTQLPVPEVPPSWEALYPPGPFQPDSHRIHAGHNSASQYVRITLQTGGVEPLTDAPMGSDAGWIWVGSPSWSADGSAILLPGTFLKSDPKPSRPCVAVLDLSTNTRTCVEMLKARTEAGTWKEGEYIIWSERFVNGDKRRVIVSTKDRRDWLPVTTEYARTVGDAWEVVGHSKGEPKIESNGLELAVEEGVNEPPRLVAVNKQRSGVIWDPNPQLKTVEQPEVSVYVWRNKDGEEWRGGLYKPTNYKVGQRYPLVIQTHGFTESEFRPSGIFPTAFAARALASAGIVVLQVAENCVTGTPNEGPCSASGYEVAVNQLVAEGLVDPQNIGIIGFSRTCYKVMYTLAFGSLHVKASSVTDGVMFDYLQYMLFTKLADEADRVVGAPPFGEGLQLWLKRSPGFNLDKVTAPVLVVGSYPFGIEGYGAESMWGVYAGLRLLHKPVELTMLNTDEHPFTNPAVRMASQGGSVDWFRFWLQGYEDPDRAKADQYKRWRQLRQMQAESDKRSLSVPSASNVH